MSKPMSKGSRRLILPLLLALSCGLTAEPGRAANRPEPRGAKPGRLAWLAPVLTLEWSKYGTMLDPNGQAGPNRYGTMADPNGQAGPNRYGIMLDPNGGPKKP